MNILRDIVAVAMTLTVAIASANPAMRSSRELELHAALDRDVPRLLVDSNVASVSIAHIEDDHLVLAAAYGSQSPGVPATTKTLYNIASMTKPISAEVILRAASQGKLTLDEPMYLAWTDPDIANDDRRKLLTARLALSHQTGFPNWRRQTGGVLTFQHTPGTAVSYSGEGYEYVARFAEKKTATDFEALAETLVLEPFGMKETAYTRKPWFDGRIAVPTDAQGKALEPSFAHHWIASDLVYTTPSDYARLVQRVMQGEGLSPAIAAEQRRIQASRKNEVCPPAKAQACPEDVGFGLGWEVLRFADATYLMHTGKDDGVFTFGYFNATTHDATIIFTNSDNGANVVLPILDKIGKDHEFVESLRSQAG